MKLGTVVRQSFERYLAAMEDIFNIRGNEVPMTEKRNLFSEQNEESVKTKKSRDERVGIREKWKVVREVGEPSPVFSI